MGPVSGYERRGLRGTVVLQEWMEAPNGHTYKGYFGTIDVLTVEEVAGRRFRLTAALRAIEGPSWSDGPSPWLGFYRAAGGGYEGLQAVAREALKGPNT